MRLYNNKRYGFKNRVSLIQNIDGKTFTVEHDVTYISTKGDIIIIPEGFITDLASIPEIPRIGISTSTIGYLASHFNLWGGSFVWIGAAIIWLAKYLKRYGTYTDAAVLHDYLYSSQKFKQHDCDRILLNAMKDCRTEKWQRLVIFISVYLFGGFAYRANGRKLHKRKDLHSL